MKRPGGRASSWGGIGLRPTKDMKRCEDWGKRLVSWESEFLGETDFSSGNGHRLLTPGGLQTASDVEPVHVENRGGARAWDHPTPSGQGMKGWGDLPLRV